jgi:hypothetical protein
VDVDEAGGGQHGGETARLVAGEAVGGVTAGARLDEPLGQQDPPSGGEDPADLAQPGSRIVLWWTMQMAHAMVHRSVRQRERFGPPNPPIQTVDTSSGADPSGESQHHR